MSARYLVWFLVVFCLLCPYQIGKAEQKKQPCPKPYITSIFPFLASPGTRVKIQGMWFGRERGEVIFSNDKKAEIVSWTLRRIWVIVPKSSSTGPVIVKIPCGEESNKCTFKVKAIEKIKGEEQGSVDLSP
jgi:hypothetical protein